MGAAKMSQALKNSRSHAVPSDRAVGELMTIDQIIQKFDGQWVLIKIAAYDEDKWPSAGYLIGHSRSDRPLWKRMTERLIAEGKPELPYYIFQARRLIRTGEEWRQRLKELNDSDDAPEWRWPRW